MGELKPIYYKMDDTLRDVERCSFSVTLAGEGKHVKVKEKILRSNNNAVRGVETSFSASTSEEDQCTPLKVDAKSMVRVFQRAIEQAYGVDVFAFEFISDISVSQSRDVPVVRFPLAKISWKKDVNLNPIAGVLQVALRQSYEKIYIGMLDSNTKFHEDEISQMENHLLTLFHDHGPLKGKLSFTTSGRQSPTVYKATAIAAYEVKTAKQATKGILGLLSRKVPPTFHATLRSKAIENVDKEKRIRTRKDAIDGIFRPQFDDKTMHCFARRMCDEKSCRNNQKWDEDALLRTEMNPDRCIVLKGHKCVDATTLRDYWKKRNRFPKDPFTSIDIDPCDAEY